MLPKYKSILNLIFPLSGDEELISKTHHLISIQNNKTPDGIIYLSSYKDPQTRAAIHLAKYHNHLVAKQLLADLLNGYLLNKKTGDLV